MSKLAIMDYDEYVDLCDAIRHKAGTAEPLTAKSAKETVENIEILNVGLIDGTIKEFVVPEEVTSLRNYAFAGTDIEKITLHEGIKSIGNNCFNDTFQLSAPIIVPENIEYLGSGWLNAWNHKISAQDMFTVEPILDANEEKRGEVVYCGSQTNSKKVLIDTSIWGLGNDPGFNISLQDVEFITGGTVYGDGFNHQETEFIFPASIKGLSSIVYFNNNGNNQITTIKFEDHSQLCYIVGPLVSLIQCPHLVQVYVPSGQLISRPAYRDQLIQGSTQDTSLYVNLGSEVTLIGQSKFDSFSGQITIEDGITPLIINESAFAYNYMNTITLPHRLIELGDYAFGWSNIQSVYFNSVIPGSFINEYGYTQSYYWFKGCNNLTDIYVPWSEGEVDGAPWGAYNATIHYNYTLTQEE